MKNKHPGRVVEADKFVLKDESGMQRAVLSMEKEEPSLRLCNTQGQTRVDLTLDNDEVSLHLGDTSGPTRLGLRLAEDRLSFVFSSPRLGAETILCFAEDELELQFVDYERHVDASIKVNLDSTGLAVRDTEGRLLCSIPGRKV